LRVGFFTECYRPIVNGVVASVDSLAIGLRARGHEVFCFAPKAPGYIEDDGPTFRMPSLPLPARTPYRLTLPVVSRRNLNGVIAHLSLIHAHSPFVTGWMGARYARRFGIPLVYTYHTQLEQYAHYIPFDAGATRRAASSLTRRYANSADAVIVPTEAMRQHLIRMGVTSRIEVVPSGIDLGLFGSGRRSPRVRALLGAGPQDRLVVFVSRLAREKNAALLIAALTHDPLGRTRLALVGDGPARAALQAQAAELGVAARVRFVGELPREQLPDVYASAEAFAFPSLSETQGLVLAEALAAGAPVISVDTPQAREVLGDQAIYVDNRAMTVAQAFEKVDTVQGPRERALRQTAAEAFGSALQTERTLSLYAAVLEGQTALAH